MNYEYITESLLRRTPTKRDYVKWFKKIIEEEALKLKIEDISKNLFLETIIPKTKQFQYVSHNEFRYPIFDIYKNVYFSKCRYILGRYFSRKTKIQPLSIVCLDVENTKSGYNPSSFQLPHLHTLTIVSDEQLPKMLELTEAKWRLKDADKRISQLDIRRVTDLKQGLDKPISYIAKFAAEKASDDRFSKTFEIFPNHKNKSYLR